MFKRNPGRLNQKISVLRPSAPTRDELGGLVTTNYETVFELFAMVEQRSQSRQQVIGDYVTLDTRYFVVRDFRELAPNVNTSWRIEYNGYTYNINDLTLINESRPYFIQITATAINTGGGIV